MIPWQGLARIFCNVYLHDIRRTETILYLHTCFYHGHYNRVSSPQCTGVSSSKWAKKDQEIGAIADTQDHLYSLKCLYIAAGRCDMSHLAPFLQQQCPYKLNLKILWQAVVENCLTDS